MKLGRMNRRQRQHQMNRAATLVKREDEITLGTPQELYGGQLTTPLFSPYTDRPLMSFSMAGAYHPVLDWIGWEDTLIDLTNKGFISYMAADGAAASSPTSGVQADPCASGNTVEYGTCDYVLNGFGRLRRETPPRSDDHDGLMYHEKIDLHRIDGTLIGDEKEYDMFVCTSVLIQDLHRQLIVGNSSNAGEFDGLENLVIDGYLDSQAQACNAMDAYVVDWAGLDMSNAVSDSNGTPITINGTNVPNGTYNLYGMLEWILRNIKIRLSFAPTLRNRIVEGDAVLMMPSSWIKPFLNMVTCYVKCGGDYARMTTDAALTFYNNLWQSNESGEQLADARIIVEGTPIVITGFDYELDNGDGTADMYLLIKGNNGMQFLYGEYKDNEPTVANQPERYATTDGNMLLTYAYYDQTCSVRVVQMQARLHMPAPWAQVRILNVPYEGVLAAISSDPLNTNFFGNLIKAGF